MLRHIFLAIIVASLFLTGRFFFGQDDDSGNVLKLNNSKEFSLVVLDDNYDLIKDTLDINLHMKYVEGFLKQPRYHMHVGNRIERKDQSLIDYYNFYYQSKSQEVKNIGTYILGIYYCSIGNHNRSLNHFKELTQIDSTNRFNYYKARTIINSNDPKSGVLLLKNLHEEGYRKDSTLKYLIHGLYRNSDFTQVNHYLNSINNSVAYLSDDEQLNVYKKTGTTLEYILKYIRLKATKFPFYASFFVALCWLVIILRLNTFYSSILLGSILTLTLSALSMIFLIDIVYETYRGWLYADGFRLTDFTYCVSVIGLGEEIIKALPLLVTIAILRPKDPVQILIYGALSGLMFSFIENISYINKYGVNIISVRGYSPTILHIVLTASVAYSYIYSSFVSKKNLFVWVLLTIIFAAFVHGVYDYFIFLNNYLKMSGFVGFSYIIIYILVLAFGMFIANTLSISPLFSEEKSTRLSKNSFLIIACLFAIEFFEYGSVLYYSGQNRADLWIIVNLASAVFSVYFLALCITYKDLIKGRWSWYNAVPFINHTYLNEYINRTLLVRINGAKISVTPVKREVDKRYNSNFLSIQSDGLTEQYEGLKLIMKFNRKWWEFKSLNNIQLGYFAKSGQFKLLENVKIDNIL